MLYDTFIFFNELELLEIRLHELEGVVDRFVLVEATRTFTNQPKPLCFKANRARFSPFLHKLIYVEVHETLDGQPPGVVEDFHRDAIARGLTGCKPDDLVLLSDVDEIPTAESVARAARSLPYRSGRAVAAAHWLLKQPAMIWTLRAWLKRRHPFVRVFEQSFHKFYFNCVRPAPPFWPGTRLVRFRDLGRPADLRRWQGQPVPNGGWHFSSMGGVERVRAKIAAYSHQEFNKPEYTDPDKLAQAMREGRNLNVPDMKLRFEPLNASYPAHLRANLPRFKDWIREGE